MSDQLVLTLKARVVYGLFDDLTEAARTELVADLRNRLRDIIGNASGNGLITDDLAAVLEQVTIRVENETTGDDAVPVTLNALCNETGTFSEDWVETSGPESGCGDDYYYDKRDGLTPEKYWVNIDQDHVTVKRLAEDDDDE